MASIHLLYGFTEGQWHGKKFRACLKSHGHMLVQDITKADFVIAHSGGCYQIPVLRDDQILILINPTYWPGRSLGRRTIAMIAQLILAVKPGNQPFYHLYKSLHNLFYLPYHHRKNLFMSRRAKTFNLEQEIAHKKTILVRNSQDPWLTPNLDHLQTINPKLQIIHLPGEHDDLWLNPEPYLALLT